MCRCSHCITKYTTLGMFVNIPFSSFYHSYIYRSLVSLRSRETCLIPHENYREVFWKWLYHEFQRETDPVLFGISRKWILFKAANYISQESCELPAEIDSFAFQFFFTYCLLSLLLRDRMCRSGYCVTKTTRCVWNYTIHLLLSWLYLSPFSALRFQETCLTQYFIKKQPVRSL